MPLKIFIPDWTDDYDRPYCVPPLYPFLRNDKTQEQLIETYGAWIENVEIVNALEDCDVVVLLYELRYYYLKNNIKELQSINARAAASNKVTICWVKGDEGITPKLFNFQLYRPGGYKSRNKGNQFCIPVFIEDPVKKYFEDQLPLIYNKSEKPVIGFCGQGRASMEKWAIDIFRGIKRRVLSFAGKWPYDLEVLISSTQRRSQILDAIERSPLVRANFIRHTKYRAGSATRQQKEETSRIYFQNMKESQYIVCYRGAGNFSVRLYETLASGRIPVIILSDNNLPLPDRIDWRIFPLIDESDWRKTAEIVYEYHSKLSDGEFVQLQQTARSIWENYLSYQGFFTHWSNKYVHNNQPGFVPANS